MKGWMYMICIMCAGACGTESGTSDKGGDNPVAVRTVVMQKSTDIRTRSYVGQAKASRGVVLLSPYSGTLTMLEVRVGETVSTGDVVAEIYSESVRSAYAMAQATLRQAEDGYARIVKVHDRGGVPDAKMSEVEASLAKARAGAAAAKDALESCMVKAPFGGTVSGIYVHQGTDVTAAEPLLRIIDPADMEIEFSVPEGELSGISEGMQAVVDIPALDIEGADAVVVTKGIEASAVSHTYGCSLRLTGPVAGLASGMVCKVTLHKDMNPDYIVPAQVVHTDRTGRYVWVLKDGTVRKVHVVTGGFSGNGVIISDGLSDGDKVIGEGFRKVSSGMKVKELER